jgi:hypothetical protein
MILFDVVFFEHINMDSTKWKDKELIESFVDKRKKFELTMHVSCFDAETLDCF